MNLYLLQLDGETDYVEAESFGDAIALWARAKVAEHGLDDGTDTGTGWHLGSEPETCAAVSDHAVIRKAG